MLIYGCDDDDDDDDGDGDGDDGGGRIRERSVHLTVEKKPLHEYEVSLLGSSSSREQRNHPFHLISSRPMHSILFIPPNALPFPG